MVKLQMIKGGCFFVVLPKDLVKKKKWLKGQELFLIFNERGNVELTDNIKG